MAVASEYLVTYLVLPCVKMLFVLSVVSCITSKTVDLKAVLSSAKTFTIFSVSLVMTGIVTVMHFQNVIAKAADSVGLRAIRFTSASLIPITTIESGATRFLSMLSESVMRLGT